MKERPILMSAPMVRALLAGKKTQTRRILKFQPANGCIFAMLGNGTHLGHFPSDYNTRNDGIITVPLTQKSGDYRLACPYGSKGDLEGDRLWVRETWYPIPDTDSVAVYRADFPKCVPPHYQNVPTAENIKWKPSIFMPRWASRISLEITDVRVEKLQDIHHNLHDLEAEGIELPPSTLYPDVNHADKLERIYKDLWNSINGPDAWALNPFVWVIQFRKL